MGSGEVTDERDGYEAHQRLRQTDAVEAQVQPLGLGSVHGRFKRSASQPALGNAAAVSGTVGNLNSLE